MEILSHSLNLIYSLWRSSPDTIATPILFSGILVVIGLLVAGWHITHHQRFLGALGRGAATTVALFLLFLFVTAGLVIANEHAVQLPARIGAVYSYDPRVEAPSSAIVTSRPEEWIIEHLENQPVLPSGRAGITGRFGSPILDFSGYDSTGETLHPVQSYEVGTVLIRRVPDERWWDDDPTFVADVTIMVSIADIGQRCMVARLVGESSAKNDFLGLFSQGYLMPTFLSWRPEFIEPCSE